MVATDPLGSSKSPSPLWKWESCILTQLEVNRGTRGCILAAAPPELASAQGEVPPTCPPQEGLGQKSQGGAGARGLPRGRMEPGTAMTLPRSPLGFVSQLQGTAPYTRKKICAVTSCLLGNKYQFQTIPAAVKITYSSAPGGSDEFRVQCMHLEPEL